MILTLGLLACALALLPLCLALVNLASLSRPEPAPGEAGLVSILVPARDEERTIGAALAAALASTGATVEVLVGDDGSRDRTAEIVRSVAAQDPRCRLIAVPPMPPGWTGKCHACACLAQAAQGRWLLFADADVRLEPTAATRLAGHALCSGSALVSGVPRQVIVSLGERLTVPMINFLLLGFLPIPLMRARPDPALGAACGQLILVDGAAYARTGGHQAIRASLHDGIALARLFRRAGLRTDLVPGHDLASCRMYEGLRQAWTGFSRNAREGMASPRALPVWTLLLLGGQVLPWCLLAVALATGASSAALGLSLAAILLSLAARTLVTLATREPPATIALHPLAVGTSLLLQWNALVGPRRRSGATWRGRTYRRS